MSTLEAALAAAQAEAGAARAGADGAAAAAAKEAAALRGEAEGLRADAARASEQVISHERGAREGRGPAGCGAPEARNLVKCCDDASVPSPPAR